MEQFPQKCKCSEFTYPQAIQGFFYFLVTDLYVALHPLGAVRIRQLIFLLIQIR